MRGISTMSLDAWLFGDEGAPQQQQQQQQQTTGQERTTPPRSQQQRPPGSSATKKKSSGHGKTKSPIPTTSPSAPVQGVSRSNSLPVNNFSSRVAARTKKASLALAIPSSATTTTGRLAAASAAAANEKPATPSSAHTELFPVSSRLRKLFRPNRLQWNRGRQSLAATAEEKQRQLLGLSSESFQRLQGHVPFTLKEIVKDPKKLPYLLRWLSTDDEEAPPTATRTNYHQVLLFLLEIEQLQLVAEEKYKEQALKIWNKYIDHGSEFEISTTLELTRELEELVHESISDSDKVLDGFFPIQKLAYMRLTREEMPLFLKSPEYLQMLIDTENDTESVPMERILQQPRAAHYFLLFLMQSRQHFELYFWLHVEYVLKPLLESESYDLFWKLARGLLKKAQNDSQAITVATKHDLQAAIDLRKMDDKQHPPQPIAKALFHRAQQEIFVMLRSSWFNRFMKSNLYKVALKDCQIHLNKGDRKEDSPPKLLSRTFSSLEYAEPPREEQDEDDDAEAPTNAAANKSDEIRIDRHHSVTIPMDGSIPTELPSGSDDSSSSGSNSNSDSEVESETGSDSGGADDAIDFSKMVLNLESIIRLTKLPDGLQVHYRPHYDAPATTLLPTHEIGADHQPRQQQPLALDSVLTFATFVEQHGTSAEPKATLMLMPVANPHVSETPKVTVTQTTARDAAESFDEIAKRIKAFLVPDGRLTIQLPTHSPPPHDLIFPYQQSGRDGFLYGCVYLTYEAVGASGLDQQQLYVAKGICVLSRFPLVRTLRRMLETHVMSHLDHELPRDGLFDPTYLALLFEHDVRMQSMELVSQIPDESLRRCTRTESGTTHLSLRKSLLDTRVDVSVQPLFDQFGTAMALQILACALLECSIVFVSSQYSLLTTCAEAVRCLLRPFSWCHVYAPVLPKPLLSYLQCPTPILVGLHSSYADRSDLPTSGFYGVADMDRDVFEFMDNRHTVAWRRLGLQEPAPASSSSATNRLFLPKVFETAKRRLDKFLSPQTKHADRLPRRSNATRNDGMSYRNDGGDGDGDDDDDDDAALWKLKNDEERIRVVCFELLSSLVEGHTEACLVVGDTKESVVIFDETQFLASRIAAEDALFYQALFRTQCFSEIVSAHRIDVAAMDQHDNLSGADDDDVETTV